MDQKEKRFESDIETYLLAEGGYTKGTMETYDKTKAIDFTTTDNIVNANRLPTSILSVDCESRINSIHPTQKPVALFEYLIKTYTNEGNVVLDNCSGSGTTAIACLNSNRQYICIEKDEIYYKRSLERLANHEPLLHLQNINEN